MRTSEMFCCYMYFQKEINFAEKQLPRIFSKLWATIITLNIVTDRPQQTVKIQIRFRRMRHLIRVFSVCHLSITVLDTSTGSQIDFIKFLVRSYGVPILKVNTVF